MKESKRKKQREAKRKAARKVKIEKLIAANRAARWVVHKVDINALFERRGWGDNKAEEILAASWKGKKI